MEDLYVKILVALSGTILMLVVAGIKYMISKLKEIVPEAEIKQLIKEGTATSDMKTAMVYERLQHIESQLDKVMDILIDHGRKNRKN